MKPLFGAGMALGHMVSEVRDDGSIVSNALKKRYLLEFAAESGQLCGFNETGINFQEELAQCEGLGLAHRVTSPVSENKDGDTGPLGAVEHGAGSYVIEGNGNPPALLIRGFIGCVLEVFNGLKDGQLEGSTGFRKFEEALHNSLVAEGHWKDDLWEIYGAELDRQAWDVIDVVNKDKKPPTLIQALKFAANISLSKKSELLKLSERLALPYFLKMAGIGDFWLLLPFSNLKGSIMDWDRDGVSEKGLFVEIGKTASKILTDKRKCSALLHDKLHSDPPKKRKAYVSALNLALSRDFFATYEVVEASGNAIQSLVPVLELLAEEEILERIPLPGVGRYSLDGVWRSRCRWWI